jgi:peptidyl-prolyl cis-trans isomerase SurA
MKILIIPFILFAFGLFGQERMTIDKIAAQIGENIILQSDIEAQKLQALSSGVELTPNADCQILEDLMFQNLLLNQAELDSIEITDAQVDAEMENRVRVIEQQIGSRQKMEEYYGKTITQIKIEFRPLIKKRMLSEEMQRQITSKVTITPKEVEAFFKTIPVDSIPLINSQLSFQQIVIFPSITKDDKAIAKKTLQDILDGIKRGKKFEDEAKKYSQDPGSAPKGGVMNATRGMMVAPFEAAVFSLKVGEVSEVFETEFGYHIVKLIQRTGDDYICSHILIIPEFSRESLNDAGLKIEECYTKLKSNEITWDDAVLKYSNDENTKQNKGIITNPITGQQTWSMEDLNQVDQQIYLLTDALNKGDISTASLYYDFNERKQGVRIVRLMERTNPHRANLLEDYALIQSAAENKKREDVLKAWTDSKIHNAYIRIDKGYSNCAFDHKWSTNL